MIATPDGERKVSDLEVGCLVETTSGVQRVKFIGKTTNFIVDLRGFGKMPIQISAGALGAEMPSRDFLCSPSHAVLVEGVLVEAQALVNGSSIKQLDDIESFSFTYYSIELESHGLIWADGLLAETYFANVRGKGFSRDNWDNYSDYVALYGEGEPMQELELPRIPFARQLPAEIRQLAGVPDPAEAEAALYSLS